MSVIAELVAAIEADPADEASQLVVADFLQAAGDPRGDLIVLDHAERRGLLNDPEAIEQLLLLAAEYSFPRAEPEEPLLVFHQSDPHRYEARHDDSRYLIVCEGGHDDSRYLVVYEGGHDDGVLIGDPHPDVDSPWRERHELDIPARWTPDLERFVFQILSDAIRAGSPLDELRFAYDGVHLPRYEGGPLRCYRLALDFTIPRGILRNRYGLAARDYHRWHAIWNRLRAMQRHSDAR